MLVSFTAVASNDFSDIGHTIRDTAPGRNLVLADRLSLPARPATTLEHHAQEGLIAPAIRNAALRDRLPEAVFDDDQIAPPRFELKEGVKEGDAPQINRDNKGDPYVPLRPSLSRRGRDLAPVAGFLSPPVPDTRNSSRPALKRGAVPVAIEPDWRLVRPHVPMTHDRATTERSPLAARQGSSGIGKAGGITPRRDGATPPVARVETFAAMTPVTHSWSPVEVAAVPVTLQTGASRFVRRYSNQPHYAALIDPGKRSAEMRCLAEAIYFEARSEPELGQSAVAQVVMNRVASSLYPDSICGVVYQNRHRHLACQFTFACEGRSLRIREPAPWRRAERLATEIISGTTFIESVGLATHYHADYVNPRWARALLRRDKIGRHIFYQLRPGQR